MTTQVQQTAEGFPPVFRRETPAVPGTQVLQVVLSLSPGGTERLVVEMSRRLHQRHGMAVCCLDEPGAWAHELLQDGIRVTALGRQPGFSPRLGRRIATMASEEGATVVHCHHYSPFVYGTLARLWRRQLRIVFTEHGRTGDGPPSPKRRVANRMLALVPSGVYAVSEDLRRHMVAEGFPPDRVQVIRNGVPLGPAADDQARREGRRRLGARPDELLIGAVGRLDPVKDLRTLLLAFAELAVSLPHARLVLIGGGPERRTIEDAVARADFRDQVTMTGHRTDVRELLPGLDIYVNSSIFEGISLTILEAMAAGLPVVATRVGGTPEVVLDGSSGFLVPSREPRAIAAALRSCAADRARARAMGAAGRQRVIEEFSIDRMVRRYAAIYDELGGR